MTLNREIARLLAANPAAKANPDDKPACAFGYIVDERLQAIRDDLAELRTMTRWLFFLVFSTFVSVIVQRLL